MKEELAKTLFIPLLNDNKPSESGPLVVRYLTTNLNIPQSNTAFHFDLEIDKINSFNRIIIVDDCIGSGQHLKDFWNGTVDKKGLKNILPYKEKDIYFLSLIGYINTIVDLYGDGLIEGLKIVLCDQLTDDHRILNASHNAWRDEHEWQFAQQYLKNLCRNLGIDMLGYNKLDFAVFIHNTAPDWTLPIFWKNIDDEWFNLVNRKNTNQ